LDVGVCENQRDLAVAAFQTLLNEKSSVKYFQEVCFAIYGDKKKFAKVSGIWGIWSEDSWKEGMR
jgi:hypothetical protein